MRLFLYAVWPMVLAVYGISVQAASVSKVEKKDESQQAYHRQAVFVIPEMALESNKVSVDISYCRGKCHDRGAHNFLITPQLKHKLDQQVIEWLYQKRFDAIVLEPDALRITTADKTLQVPANGMAGFHVGTVPLSKWEKAVEKYLNTKLAPYVLPLQKAALEQRYRELDEQERATFIRTQAKSLGLPLDVVIMLLRSQYVMAMYQPSISGKLAISYVNSKNGDAYYENSMTFNLKNKLYIYQYDVAQHKFKFFRKVTGESGDASESLKTKHYPHKRDLNRLFDIALRDAERASLIQIVHKLKNIKPFIMQSAVLSVDGRDITSSITAKGDLRVDALYKIQRKVGGEFETVGLAKARFVAAQSAHQGGISQFKVIKGDVQQADLMVETDWMGSYWGVDLLKQEYKFDRINGIKVARPDQNMSWIRWQARWDEGYFKNIPKSIEKWSRFYVGLGFGDTALEVGSSKWDAPVGLQIGMDFMTHNTAGYGWSFGYGFGVDFNWLTFKTTQDGASDDLTYGSLDVSARGEATYLLSEKSQVSVYVMYPFSLFNQVKIGEQEVDASVTPGLTIGVGYQRAFETMGLLQRFYRH